MLMLILSLLDFRQNQNPETVLLCIVVQCFPHDKIVRIHKCDECMRSHVLNVFHKFASIFVMARVNLFSDHEISSPPIQVSAFQNNLCANC